MRPVDPRDRYALLQTRYCGGDSVDIGHEGDHSAAFRKLLHEPAASRNELERVFKTKNAGDAGGHVLTDAMSDREFRLDTPGKPHLGQRIFNCEQGRLGVFGLIEEGLSALRLMGSGYGSRVDDR